MCLISNCSFLTKFTVELNYCDCLLSITKKILIPLLIGYGLTVLISYSLHHRIMFQPTPLAEDYQFDFEHPFSEKYLQDDSLGISLHALHFTVPDTAKGIVLYFHGNADNLQRWGRYTVDLTQRNYEVLAIDYPGYGKSEGEPSEAAIYRSADLAYAWARERYAPEQIVIYGRSMGGAPASWLAGRQPAQQLILETPFPSVPKLFRTQASVVLVPFEPRIKFPVIHYLESVPCPVTIFHGTDDWVVPYRAAAQLKSVLKPADRFITIEGGGHKDLRSFSAYQQSLTDLLQ